MYEDREGEFVYSVRRQRFHGGANSWHWQVHSESDGVLLDAGTSGRSHEAAKTAALSVIFGQEFKVRQTQPC